MSIYARDALLSLHLCDQDLVKATLLVAAVVVHGTVKESTAPDRDIDLAIRRKARFEADPLKHTLKEK